MPAISRPHRRWRSGFVICKIPCRKNAAILFHPRFSSSRKRPAVKPTRPLLCNRAIRPRQIRLPQQLPRRFRRTIRVQQQRPARGKLCQPLCRCANPAGVRRRNCKPFLGHRRRRFQMNPQRQFPVRLRQPRISRQRPRHPTCQRPELAQPRIRLAIAQIHIPMRLSRSRFAAINRNHPPIRQPRHNKATASDSGVIPIHHPQSEPRRHRRVDGISALFHHPNRRIRRQRIHRSHCAMLGKKGKKTQKA